MRPAARRACTHLVHGSTVGLLCVTSAMKEGTPVDDQTGEAELACQACMAVLGRPLACVSRQVAPLTASTQALPTQSP